MYIFNAVQLLSYAVFVQEILQMISLLTIYNFWSFWLKVKRRKTEFQQNAMIIVYYSYFLSL